MHQKIALSGYVFLMIHLLYLFALNPMRPYSYKKCRKNTHIVTPLALYFLAFLDIIMAPWFYGHKTQYDRTHGVLPLHSHSHKKRETSIPFNAHPAHKADRAMSKKKSNRFFTLSSSSMECSLYFSAQLDLYAFWVVSLLMASFSSTG